MINKQYESDLLSQIEHSQTNRNAQKDEELREYEEGLKTEARYQDRLKNVGIDQDLVFLAFSKYYL